MVKKVLAGLFCLILVAISFNASAQVRTAWEQNNGEDHVSWVGETNWEGIFSHAVIPSSDDSGWYALGDFDPVDYSYDPSYSGLCQDANFPNCQDEGKFTYFRSFIDVPAESNEFSLDEFTVSAEIVNSGLRVSIFNSAYPDGAHITYAYSNNGSISADLKSYVVTGETNTVVITQAGNCCIASEIEDVQVILNGEILTICPPIAVLTRDITIALDADGNAFINPAQVDGGSTGGCGTLSLVVSPNSFTCDQLGQNTVTLTVEDSYGNSKTGTAVVTIVDTTSPAVSNCPSDIVVSNEAGQCEATVTWTPPTFADNCQVANVTSNFNPGDSFSARCSGDSAETVTYTAVDGSGNTTTCSFTVTVLDNEAPVIHDTPADIVVFNDPGKCGANVSWTAPTSTDNCGIESFTSTHTPGDFFPAECAETAMGTVVTYTAKDKCGNTTSGSFKVTVLDNEAPVIHDTPADIVVFNDPGKCGAVVTWTPPTATDNCEVASFTSNYEPGYFFHPAECAGTAVGTVVTYTAVDTCGNTTTSSFKVTVLDNEAPVISITGVTGNYEGLRLEGEYGYWDANDVVFWNTDDIVVHYEVSDNCDPNPVITYTVTWEDELKEEVGILDTEARTLTISPYELVGTLEVTITATDICGNAASDATEFEVILRVPDGKMIVKPESFCVNPGKFSTFLWFPEPYDVATISDARCDGAPMIRLNIGDDLEDAEVKGILKFIRNEIKILPVNTSFVTRGIFTYNGKLVYFQGSDMVKWDCRRFQRRDEKRIIREERRRIREQAKEAKKNRYGQQGH